MHKKLWIYTIYILLISAVLSVLYLLRSQDNKVYIVACDVGQGDGILIQKKNSQILIDGGGGDRVNDCLSRHLPFWDRQIELVVLTHPDLDHYEGLISVFRSYDVKNYMATSLISADESFILLDRLIKEENPKIIKAHAGINFSIIDLKFKVLKPANFEYQESEEENNHSVVLSFQYKDFDALFTGDIEDSGSDELSSFSDLANLEYLKVPHHGSKNGLSNSLLEITNPQLSVISVGKKNSYGHPHKEVLEILESSDTNILRTDQLGDIVVKTDGYKYNIE